MRFSTKALLTSGVLLLVGCGMTLWEAVRPKQILRYYNTHDGRCWSGFVPNNNAVEQPANAKQNAVRPLYAVEVICP